MESLLQNFVLFCFFYSHISEKFLFTENNFLPRLMKQESGRSSYCILQSVCALNTRNTKILRRSVVKVLITLLIEQ